MARKANPDHVPYLKILLGLPTNVRMLDTTDQDKLDLASNIIMFTGTSEPRKAEMSAYLTVYAHENGKSRSWAYKILTILKDKGLVKFDDYFQEYRINLEKPKRDLHSLRQFDSALASWGLKSKKYVR